MKKDDRKRARRQADRLIQATKVEDNLRPTGLIAAKERQLRPLSKLEPEQQQARDPSRYYTPP